MDQAIELDDRGPLVALRERLGLSRTELALLARLSYGTLFAVEKGLTPSLPRRLVECLARLEVDVAAVERGHHQWLDARAQALSERVRERMRE